MYRLRSFLEGRCGIDALNIGLMIIGCVLNLCLSFLPYPYYYIKLISIIPFAFMLFRFFSRNVIKRGAENQRFINFMRPIIAWGKKVAAKHKVKSEQRADGAHKYYKCPKCKKVLRVPANRGKIEIDCPFCNTKFKKYTGKKL